MKKPRGSQQLSVMNLSNDSVAGILTFLPNPLKWNLGFTCERFLSVLMYHAMVWTNVENFQQDFNLRKDCVVTEELVEKVVKTLDLQNLKRIRFGPFKFEEHITCEQGNRIPRHYYREKEISPKLTTEQKRQNLKKFFKKLTTDGLSQFPKNKLSVQVIRILIENCPRLESLDISECNIPLFDKRPQYYKILQSYITKSFLESYRGGNPTDVDTLLGMCLDFNIPLKKEKEYFSKVGEIPPKKEPPSFRGISILPLHEEGKCREMIGVLFEGISEFVLNNIADQRIGVHTFFKKNKEMKVVLKKLTLRNIVPKGRHSSKSLLKLLKNRGINECNIEHKSEFETKLVDNRKKCRLCRKGLGKRIGGDQVRSFENERSSSTQCGTCKNFFCVYISRNEDSFRDCMTTTGEFKMCEICETSFCIDCPSGDSPHGLCTCECGCDICPNICQLCLEILWCNDPCPCGKDICFNLLDEKCCGCGYRFCGSCSGSCNGKNDVAETFCGTLYCNKCSSGFSRCVNNGIVCKECENVQKRCPRCNGIICDCGACYDYLESRGKCSCATEFCKSCDSTRKCGMCAKTVCDNCAPTHECKRVHKENSVHVRFGRRY